MSSLILGAPAAGPPCLCPVSVCAYLFFWKYIELFVPFSESENRVPIAYNLQWSKPILLVGEFCVLAWVCSGGGVPAFVTDWLTVSPRCFSLCLVLMDISIPRHKHHSVIILCL